MRKAIFAVMLVGASFAGGAVVNGPGLRWAQTMILSHLSGDGDDNDEHDETADSAVTPKSTVGQEPLAPIPSDPIAPAGAVVTSPASPEKDAAKPETPRPEPAAAAAIADAAAISAGQRPQPAAPTLPKSDQERRLGAETPEFATAPAELKSSNDPEIALTNVPSPLPESHSTPLEPLDPLPPLALTVPDAADNKEKGQASGWGDAPGSAPAAAVPPRSLGADATSSPKPLTAPALDQNKAKNGSALAVAAPRPPSDWAEIRRRMAALGVSRYGIEGEPNGKVRFHCVIPLAGQRAVAQQFEAEGDDELQAAEVALRRVTLWRATENPGS